MVVNTSDNRWATSNFIVAPTLAEGGSYTTIAAALTAASSGNTIFIKPGSYTENLTLKSGVNLVAFSGDGDTPNVTIVGKATATFAGTCTISNIRLQTNSDFFLVVSGSSATIVNLDYCFLNCSNNTGISFTTSSSSAKINVFHCQGDLGTTGIGYFASSSAGSLNYRFSFMGNSGSSTTANTISAGAVDFFATLFTSPITTSSTGLVTASKSQFNLGTNTTVFTIGGGTTSTIQECYITSGTASAITVSVAGLNLCNNIITSSNTNAITGAGTAGLTNIIYTGTSHQTNVTTQTGGSAMGLTQGTAPSAGYIGEQIRGALASASAITVTPTNTVKNVTSINLTAGIWDVSGIVGYQGAAGLAGTNIDMGISTTSATIAGNYGDDSIESSALPTAGSDSTFCIPSLRITLSTTTTVYLVTKAVFTGGTWKAYGRISGTRVG